MSMILILSSCKDDLFTPDLGIKYKVIFEGNWSADNHPTDFPNNDHFSDFIGLTHNEQVTLFEEGGFATEGMEVMAETGAVNPLDSQILNIVLSDSGFDYITNDAPNRGNGDKEFIIYVDEDHPLVSIVSMIAPSPDWFLGVKDYNLFQNGAWVDEITIPVTVWDAGTDSGTTFTSEDLDTNPKEPIQILTSAPLGNGTGITPPLGYFTFKLR